MKALVICLLLFQTPGEEFEAERLRQLKGVRRLYIDKLGGENAEHVRDALMTFLLESRLFVVTENQEKADAILRGSTQYSSYIDVYQYGESTQGRGSSSTSARTTSGRRYSTIGAGENESARITERREAASAALRLVNQQGDLIWSTNQESRGAKFRGAAADVAAKVARKLMDDYNRARRSAPATGE